MFLIIIIGFYLAVHVYLLFHFRNSFNIHSKYFIAVVAVALAGIFSLPASYFAEWEGVKVERCEGWETGQRSGRSRAESQRGNGNYERRERCEMGTMEGGMGS